MIDHNSGSPLRGVAQGKTKSITDKRGTLSVLDIAENTPFVPVRMFWITDVVPGTSRGGHAHKACSQFLVCAQGRIDVEAFDGTISRSFMLTQGDFINLPPGIFATETFLDENSVLLVICDRPFEAEDYIDERETLVPVEGDSRSSAG
jgi:hypothetical protein